MLRHMLVAAAATLVLSPVAHAKSLNFDAPCTRSHPFGSETSSFKLFTDDTFVYSGKREIKGPSLYGTEEFTAEGTVSKQSDRMILSGTEDVTTYPDGGAPRQMRGDLSKTFTIQGNSLVSTDGVPLVCEVGL